MLPRLLLIIFTLLSLGYAQRLTHISNRYPDGNKDIYPIHEDLTGYDSTHKTFMREQAEYYSALNISAEEYYQINQPALMDHSNTRSVCNLNKMVFGWHPYWQNGFEANYDWNLVSDFCYFSYEVDAATGNASSTHSWATTNSVDTALARGLKVHLCVTLFSGHATFFSSPTAQTTLINNLINLLNTRGAHGINIDFEGLPSSQATNFTNFMINLCNAVHANDPNMMVSVCLYAVDWSNVFNETVLSNYVDFFTIMGYDYYYSGSSQAGPTDPLYGFNTGYDRSLSRTITYYLDEGIPENKLVLGLPYYGKEWETTSNTIPSSTTGNFTYSRTFRFIRDNTSGLYNSPIQNERSVSNAYVFMNGGTWRQAWLSEGYEMEKRYDWVKRRNIKGIAIWTLGYDDGYTELWEAIENKFTDCEVVPCIDTIYDGGGPEMNYYDNEEYTYTISPAGATSLTLDFLSFETEAGYDTLFLYDGPDVSSTLIGAYTGTVSPGTVVSTGPSITVRFKSDISTRAPGWVAVWTCSQDNVPPSTEIQSPSVWVTQDETVDFDDNDNLNLQYSFWNVADLDNGHWHSNITHGFCYDEFDELTSDWNIATGTWTQSGTTLLQSDELLTNTNIYINVDQNGFDEYLYAWRARTGGTGANRRSGFHFMCDDPTLPNRGNSYFVWFRPDQNQLQFYEVTADVFNLMHTVTLTTTPNVWYNYKVIYNKTTGRMDVYVNDANVGYWQDPTPLTVGNGVSFRTGNATLEVDELVVYRQRTISETVTAGTSVDMLRFQNPDPFTPAGCIRSVVVDVSDLWAADTLYKHVDFTYPAHASFPTEELSDVDTLLNVGSFLAYVNVYDDPHSGVSNVYYGIGTTPFLDDVISFATLPLGDSVNISTAALVNGEYYYLLTYADNYAGLTSDTINSDGFLFINNVGIEDNDLEPNFYPNPVTEFLIIELPNDTYIRLVNVSGQVVFNKQLKAGPHLIHMQEFAAGYYFLSLGNKTYKICVAH